MWEVARAVLSNPDKLQAAEMTDLAIRIMFNVFSWEVRLALIDGKIEAMATAEALVTKRDEFVKYMKDIVYNGSAGVETVGGLE